MKLKTDYIPIKDLAEEWGVSEQQILLYGRDCGLALGYICGIRTKSGVGPTKGKIYTESDEFNFLTPEIFSDILGSAEGTDLSERIDVYVTYPDGDDSLEVENYYTYKYDKPFKISVSSLLIQKEDKLLFEKKHNELVKSQDGKTFHPKDVLGVLMLNLAEIYMKSRKGLISSDEMLALLRKHGATINKNNKDELVKFTDSIKKEVINLSRSSFSNRLTRIRNYVKK